MQRTRISCLSCMLSCNLYGPPLAQLQRQRETGAVSGGAMELDRPGTPVHAQLLSGTAGLSNADHLVSRSAGTRSARAAVCTASIQDQCH